MKLASDFQIFCQPTFRSLWSEHSLWHWEVPQRIIRCAYACEYGPSKLQPWLLSTSQGMPHTFGTPYGSVNLTHPSQALFSIICQSWVTYASTGFVSPKPKYDWPPPWSPQGSFRCATCVQDPFFTCTSGTDDYVMIAPAVLAMAGHLIRLGHVNLDASFWVPYVEN